jgi:hypothetical protein
MPDKYILTEENYKLIERVANCYRVQDQERIRARLRTLKWHQWQVLDEERVQQEERAHTHRNQTDAIQGKSSLAADYALFLARFDDVLYPDASTSTHPCGRPDFAAIADRNYEGYAE